MERDNEKPTNSKPAKEQTQATTGEADQDKTIVNDRFRPFNWKVCYMLWGKHKLRTAYQEGRFWLARN